MYHSHFGYSTEGELITIVASNSMSLNQKLDEIRTLDIPHSIVAEIRDVLEKIKDFAWDFQTELIEAIVAIMGIDDILYPHDYSYSPCVTVN